MNRTTGIIVAVVVVLGLLGLAVFVVQDSKPTETDTTRVTGPGSSTSKPVTTNTNSPTATTDKTASDTINYTNTGFSPATLTVKAGSTVTIKNSSSRVMQFDSNPHPQHTDDPELNVGSISPGQSKTVTVTKTGTHGYHNHLNESDTGTLTVQ